MAHGASLIMEEGKKLLGVGIIRTDEAASRAVREFWEIAKKALRNPKDEKAEKAMETRVNHMLADSEERKIFEMLEREMKKSGYGKCLLEIRKDETDAFFAYASAGGTGERLKGMLELQEDVRKCADALAIIDSKAHKLDDLVLARLIGLAEKGGAGKEEVEDALGRGRDPELTAAFYTILHRQEAASVAARNALETDRSEYGKILGTREKNELVALLRFYKLVLGDAKFRRALELLAQGNSADALAEIKKLGTVAQYLLFALLVPALMRNGMWSRPIISIIGKVLGKIREAALKCGKSAEREQIKYVKKAADFSAKFADCRGLNLSMFSSAFIAAICDDLQRGLPLSKGPVSSQPVAKLLENAGKPMAPSAMLKGLRTMFAYREQTANEVRWKSAGSAMGGNGNKGHFPNEK